MIFSSFVATLLLSTNVILAQADVEPVIESNEAREGQPDRALPAVLGTEAAARPGSGEQALERILARIDTSETMTSDFTQIAPSGLTSTGKLYLRRPGQARFEYDAPSPLLIVVTQGTVYVEDKSLDQTDRYPVGKTPLRFLLDKQINLEGVRVVDFETDQDSVAISLASGEPDSAGTLTLIAALPGYELTAWSILDAQNGTTVVELANTKFGVRIPNRTFRAPEAGGSFINN